MTQDEIDPNMQRQIDERHNDTVKAETEALPGLARLAELMKGNPRILFGPDNIDPGTKEGADRLYRMQRTHSLGAMREELNDRDRLRLDSDGHKYAVTPPWETESQVPPRVQEVADHCDRDASSGQSTFIGVYYAYESGDGHRWLADKDRVYTSFEELPAPE